MEIGNKHSENFMATRSEKIENKIEKKLEQLDLREALSLTVNALFQERFIDKNEAEKFLRRIGESEGKDNYNTLAILKDLGDISSIVKEDFKE